MKKLLLLVAKITNALAFIFTGICGQDKIMEAFLKL
jgi:hypothetical protein